MSERILLRKFIAVGQKTSACAKDRPYGEGFNYWVEASFPLRSNFSREVSFKALEDVLSTIDHKALGVDVKLNVDPTSVELAVWILQELEKRLGEKDLKITLFRGDGLIVSTTL